MNKTILSLAVVSASLLMMLGSGAETRADGITPVGPNVGIERSTIEFSVPEDNSLPWAFVEGSISNPAPDYPVIIQIYDADGTVPGNDVGAVHFAQADVNPDGSFEYRFRVLNVVDGSQIDVFEGSYVVKIFKFVQLDEGLSAA